MSEVLAELYNVLNQRSGFEVVNETVTDNQVRLIHRVSKGGMPNWLMVMDCLIDAAEASAWNIDLSKQYFKRNGRLIYGWRFILQAEGVLEHVPSVIAAVKGAPRARQTVEEQPLAGASANRNSLRRGKGAQNPLKARVGPASWGNR